MLPIIELLHVLESTDQNKPKMWFLEFYCLFYFLFVLVLQEKMYVPILSKAENEM